MDLIADSFGSNEHTLIDMALMMERIAVQRPYFAFERLYQMPSDDWDIWGDFMPEQPLGHEVGPLAIAEAGRHLAILGSCAAALSQPAEKRTYYLAIHAIWSSAACSVTALQRPMLSARAQIVDCSKKRVKAHTELLLDGAIVGALQVEYQVLSEKLFEALFGRFRQEESAQVVDSPYKKALELRSSSIKRHAAKAQCVEQAEAHCAGHFPHYPMWPVAVVVYGLTRMLSFLLEKRLKRPFLFAGLQAEVHALQLVSAHEPLTFYAGVKSMSRNGRLCRMRCVASLGEKTVAVLKITLAIEAFDESDSPLGRRNVRPKGRKKGE